MQFAFFNIPATAPEEGQETLNRFLRGHRVLTVNRELVQNKNLTYWAFCVEYLEGSAVRSGAEGGKRARVDYKEKLSEADFEIYSRLREKRKELATEGAMPIWNVFTNEQLAAMVEGGVTDLAGLRKIPGVGEARIEKYGTAILGVLLSEKKEKSASGDSGPEEPA